MYVVVRMEDGYVRMQDGYVHSPRIEHAQYNLVLVPRFLINCFAICFIGLVELTEAQVLRDPVSNLISGYGQ